MAAAQALALVVAAATLAGLLGGLWASRRMAHAVASLPARVAPVGHYARAFRG